VQVRVACNEDLQRLVDIDSLAYDRERRERRINELVAGTSGSAGHVLVVVVDETVAGFLVYQQVLDRATLMDVAVHPHYQGHGLAAALMRAALAEMLTGGAARCELEVRASNHRAIGLYRAFQFIPDGVRAGYYPAEEGREDALLMSLNFGGAGNERAGN
jgi:ribosomal-protein-alanine N-acetyltransferase